MNKSFLLVVFLNIIAVTAFAQEKKTYDDDRNKYITGTDYSSYKKRRALAATEAKPEANVIKIGLTSWVSGNIPVYYERRVAPWLGLQVGLGLTTRDFVADLVTDVINVYRFNNPPAAYNDYAFYGNQGRKSSVGVYVSFQPKFYPRRNALGGFFVSPMVEFKRYDFFAQYADPTIVSDMDQPTYLTSKMGEYRNTVDFTVNVGRQWLLSSKVSIELMGGVGFRRFWEQRRFINEYNSYNPISGNNSGYTFTTTTAWFTAYRPEFNLSFIIGGYF